MNLLGAQWAAASNWALPSGSGTGDWFNSVNWSGGVPTSSSIAAFSNGGTAFISANTASAAACDVGSGSTGSGTLLLEDGTLALSAGLAIANGGTGNFIQSGGTLSLGTGSDFYVGSLGNGTVVQSNGTVAFGANSILDIGYYGNGTYQLSGGLIGSGHSSAAVEYVGDYAAGTFLQSGGLNSGTFIYLGNNTGGSGYYQLSGGTLNPSAGIFVGYQSAGTLEVNGGTLAASVLSIGRGLNGGTFLQNGGLVNATEIALSANSVLSLNGGMVNATEIALSPNSLLRLSGGTFSFNDLDTASNSTIDLSAGNPTINYSGFFDLSAPTVLGGSGASVTGGANSLMIVPAGFDPQTRFANFSTGGIVHTAGTPLTIPQGTTITAAGTVSDHTFVDGTLNELTLGGGVNVSATGVWNGGSLYVNDLVSGSAGNVAATGLYLGETGQPALFTQSGGTFNATQAQIGSQATYLASAGTLIFQSLVSTGTLDFANGNANFISNGINVIGSGTIVNAHSASLSVSDHSLLIVPAGFDAYSEFGNVLVDAGGLLHQQGTPIIIPQTVSIIGQATSFNSISDLLNAAGTFTAAQFLLTGGVSVQSTGSVSCGTIDVDNNLSGNLGGHLQMTVLNVGNAGVGQFLQTGGTTIGSISIGNLPDANGAFTMNGGSLASGQLYVGNAGNGQLIQGGGSITDPLLVGNSAGSNGTVIVNGGSLTGSALDIGYSGNGTFQMNAGTVSNPCYVGYNPTGVGTMIVDGGTFNASLVVGYNGNGTVIQNGGAVNITSQMILGFGHGQGTYLMNGGTISSPSHLTEYLGFNNNSTALFNQSGGTNNTGSLEVGFQTGTGTYNLQGGTLIAGFERIADGSAATGTFLQSGGSNVNSGPLHVMSAGGYLLSGGIFSSGTLDMAGGTFVVSRGYPGVVTTNNFTASSGGKIDLADAPMAIDYTGASPLLSIESAVAAGSIYSSLTREYPQTALAVGEASEADITSLRGQAIDSTTVLVALTVLGDANLDFKVDAADEQIVEANMGKSVDDWTQGDLNGDGIVNQADLDIVTEHLGDTLASVIPEPAIGMAAMALVLLIPRRRIGKSRS